MPAGLQFYRPGPWSPNLGRPGWLRRWISRRRLRRARQLLRDRGCSKIVLYLWRPYFANSLDLVDHELSCYHIDDEYSFSPVERGLDPAEVQLIRKVDQVFVHSPAMMGKKGGLNPNSQLIPNGVDYRRYVTPAPEPAEFQNIRKPRIGYTGNLKDALDWSLLLELSDAHPEWSFVFVGHMLAHGEVQGLVPELSRRKNIHLLGSRSTELIPDYVQHLDVCIMPYKINDYTKYIYPLKLHEYLASGNPVVGSPIACLQAFQEVVLLANGTREWSSMISRALSPAEKTFERCAVRQRVAAGYDWDHLVQQLAATLARRLGCAFHEVKDSNNQDLRGQSPLGDSSDREDAIASSAGRNQ